MESIDMVEAQIRRTLNLPARKLEIVSVQEDSFGRFLLSLCRGRGSPRDLRIEDADVDRRFDEAASVAVVTRSSIDELDELDAVEIGHRYSPATWTIGGPTIQVSGTTAEGLPFEQTFHFVP